MKKIILIAVLSIAAICLFAGKAQSKGFIVYGWGDEKLHTVIDLPNDETSYDEELDGYLNIGYFYKQVWVLWIPMWNWDGQYCWLKEGDNDTYYPISDEELEQIKAAYNLDLPSNPIPFWDKIGGKLIWIAVIAVLIWGSVGKAAKKKDEEQPA